MSKLSKQRRKERRKSLRTKKNRIDARVAAFNALIAAQPQARAPRCGVCRGVLGRNKDSETGWRCRKCGRDQ